VFKKQLTGLLICALYGAFAHGDIIDGEELFDPTRPLIIVAGTQAVQVGGNPLLESFRSEELTNFEVSFVRASESRPMAVVNQQRVTIGDLIGGAEVVAIDRDGVTLAVDGFERRVSVFSNSVKGPVRR